MSNKKINVLWIDDETDRTDDAKNIAQKAVNLRIEVIHPKEEKMKERLEQIKDKKNLPDLFLIDYFLDRKAIRPRGEIFETRALSLAGRIRELLPEYPIYVSSNKERDSEGIFASEAQAAKASFDRILTLRDVQRYGHSILYFDALDYRLIRKSERNKIDTLFKLLNAPEGITDKLKLVLPDELQYGLSSPSRSKIPFGNAISFANWVRELILSIPGFLYDKLYTATYLGMKKEYFKKVSSKFKKAIYSGVFARTSPNLWWITELNKILFSKSKAQKSEKAYPWEVAQLVFQTPKNSISRCVVCNGIFPESVGINLNDENDLKPVHYKCSRPHPKKKRTLYFDELRTFDI